MPVPAAFAELHCLSNFTFLTGASHPEELVARARELGYAALALTDECSLAGTVRAHAAAKESGLPLIVGSEIRLADGPRLVLLASDREGYGNLAEFITLGRRRAAKGAYCLERTDLAGGLPGCLALWLADESEAVAEGRWLQELFPGRAWLAVALHRTGGDRRRIRRLSDLGAAVGLPLVAVGSVLMHVRERKPLQDVLTAIRLNLPVHRAGHSLQPNAERHLRSLEALSRFYPGDLLAETLRVAEHCRFSLDELRYEYPAELVPPGLTPAAHLRRLTEQGMGRRWPGGVPGKVRRLVEHELALIAELRYEPYFLTVHDIVRFACQRGILCQGRGSAANSAVCYCLGITEVDPARMEMLFERFISRERNEPPDIDVDFEHQRREEVLQYIYRKYGRHRAALAATVITYRPKSAIRDVGKALGLGPDQVDRLAGAIAWWDGREIAIERLREAGLDPASPVIRRVLALVQEIQGFPRHLSQHVGGMVISHGPISRLVPVENAAMAGRTVIQWDKDDLDALGLLKVDCLALGMLSAIRRAFDLINGYHRWNNGDGLPGRGGSDSSLATKAAARRAETLPPAPAAAVVGWGERNEPRQGAAARPAGVTEGSCEPLGMHNSPPEGEGEPFVRWTNAVDRKIRQGGGGRCRVPGTVTGCEPLGMHNIPPEDPEVYAMIQRAETTGVFQIESRAQMAMLPRLRPACFYDLVIEVAIVRPGPIQGDMVHPYLRRRQGLEAVEYPSEEVKGVLGRTLGVPIFQEQVIKVAQVAAGFSPGEADRLRRSIGAWRRRGTLEQFEQRLIDGMTARGYAEHFARQIYQQILGFGEYGFPESHAASFALLVYVSAWLKHHHPAAFFAALINSQPMGFYAPAQLIREALRQGVTVRPVDVRFSGHDCSLEQPFAIAAPAVGWVELGEFQQKAEVHPIAPPGTVAGSGERSEPRQRKSSFVKPRDSNRHAQPILRLGLCLVKGLSCEGAKRIEAARSEAAFGSVDDLARRAQLDQGDLKALGVAGALRGLAGDRHHAAWQVMGHQPELPLFADAAEDEAAVSLPPPTLGQDIVADYASLGLTLAPHPLALLRPALRRAGLATAAEVRCLAQGMPVSTGGIVINRQHPASARGVIFVTLEDETGHVNLVVWQRVAQRQRRVLLGARLMVLEGEVQREGEVVHVVARRLSDWSALLGSLKTRSRDFR